MEPNATQKQPTYATKEKNGTLLDAREKEKDIRMNNILAAKAVADVVRTSLGPRGMDKMITDSKGEVIITNDGATILKQLDVIHPTAKMLVDVSLAQDIEAGDGTTTVAVLAGSLLSASQFLLEKGIHPNSIADGFLLALKKSLEFIDKISKPILLDNRAEILENVDTALSSKAAS